MIQATRFRKIRPRVRILIGSATALGPGKVDLLQAIISHGLISAVSRQMGMSYRRAWMLVATMNRCFDGNLVATSTGGAGGGGAKVTLLGREVLSRYREMEANAEACVSDEVAAFAKLMADPTVES